MLGTSSLPTTSWAPKSKWLNLCAPAALDLGVRAVAKPEHSTVSQTGQMSLVEDCGPVGGRAPFFKARPPVGGPSLWGSFCGPRTETYRQSPQPQGHMVTTRTCTKILEARADRGGGNQGSFPDLDTTAV